MFLRVFPDKISIWIHGLNKQIAFSSVGIIQSLESLNRTRQRKKNLPHFYCLTIEQGHLISSSPALRLGFTQSLSWFSWFSGLQSWTLWVNYRIGLPRSPRCRWQILGLCSLCICPIINLHFIHRISYCSVSLENSNTLKNPQKFTFGQLHSQTYLCILLQGF